MGSIKLLVSLLLCVLYVNATYNSALALHLGYYSIVAYESPSAIQAWSCSYCSKYSLSDVKVFTNGASGVQGFTGYSSSLNSVIVSFRGSSNIQNWILNIGTTRKSYPACSGCSVHAGFLTAYNSVSSTVKTNVNGLLAKYRNAKLMVTGHSLGGALAILGAADLKHLHNVDNVYTFGQPRIGNTAFAQWYPGHVPNTFRVIDYADIVPHVPPSSFGFEHSSKQAWYQRGMQTYALCDAESASCANSVGTTNFSTDDHNMDHYIKLKASVQEEGNIQKIQRSISNFFNKFNLRANYLDWKVQEQRKVNQYLEKNSKQNKNIQVSQY